MSHPASSETEELTESTIQGIFSTPQDTDFANLIPHNTAAKKAFNELINLITPHKAKYSHAIQFIRGLHLEQAPAVAVFSDDEDADEATEDASDQPPFWIGSFGLTLDIAPRGSFVWVAGVGNISCGEYDMLLAPPTKEWRAQGIYGRCFQLSFHENSFKVLLTARRTVEINAEAITKDDLHVVEHGNLITVGECVYIFKFTEYSRDPSYRDDFYTCMEENLGRNYPGCLTAPRAPSAIDSINIGAYACAARAFATGAGNVVKAGWNKRTGDVVAIKDFKDSPICNLNSHQKIMRSIGRHDNIVELLSVIQDSEAQDPGAFCVYIPLGKGSLEELMATHTLDFAAQVKVFRGWACGLHYLHYDKGIMHRNINPQNLWIIGVKNPRGIIMNLDIAIDAQWAWEPEACQPNDDRYKAPEVVARMCSEIDLDDEAADASYHCSVDLWALGLSALTMTQVVNCRLPPWAVYDSSTDLWENRDKDVLDDWVTRPRWKTFRGHVARMKDDKQDDASRRFIRLCQRLMNWRKDERASAKTALRIMTDLAEGQGIGVIDFKKGVKRGNSQVSR
ncbi:MAG: hypothetical protein Q9225_004377 [Loekoesia sp. 1 TL-2023]